MECTATILRVALPSHDARSLRLSEKVCDKMPRKQTADERMKALEPFADCINEHMEVGMIQAWDVQGFHAMSKTARKKLGSVDDPYFLAFVRGIAELIDYIQVDERLALVCDDDRSTAWDCYRHYRGIKAADDEVRTKVVSLGFADHDYFPALQAAEMVAYLSRLEAKHNFYRIPYSFPKLFDYLTTSVVWAGINMVSHVCRQTGSP